jgi:5'-nucleotidase
MFILLTNDDGIDAPGLPAFARHLQRLGNIEVVVPDRERSWVGKAITRFDPVRVEKVVVGGVEMHTTTGYPADCVQLGVHALFGRKPDLVVSGVNVGYNHGSAYLQSSGTVGAALEGAISGVPSIAFSTGVSNRPWAEWKEWAESPDSTDMWDRLAVVATAMVEQMLGSRLRGAVSVGLPDSADLDTERRLTTVARVEYDRLFAETSPGTYHHTFGGLVENGADMAGTDIEAAMQDVIAITPVEGAGFSEYARQLAELLLTIP